MSETFYEHVVHFWTEEPADRDDLYELISSVVKGKAFAVVFPERLLTAEEYQQHVAARRNYVHVEQRRRPRTLYLNTLVLATATPRAGRLIDELICNAGAVILGPMTQPVSHKKAEQHEDFNNLELWRRVPFSGAGRMFVGEHGKVLHIAETVAQPFSRFWSLGDECFAEAQSQT